VKTNPLPNTDLANFAAFTGEEKWRRLLGFKKGIPPLAYKVARRYYADLMHLSAGPLTIEPVDIEKLAARIWTECRVKKDDIEATSNVLVARGIRELAERLKISGRVAHTNELLPRLIADRYVECWDRLILNIDGHAVIAFFDLRRSGSQLTLLGRQVTFSLMHENIRTHPDFAHVRLAIVQFDDDEVALPSGGGKKMREASIVYDNNVELFGFHELKEMICDTDRMWLDICKGREFDARLYRTEDEDETSPETPPFIRLWRKKA
jgi:hypothetical protein